MSNGPRRLNWKHGLAAFSLGVALSFSAWFYADVLRNFVLMMSPATLFTQAEVLEASDDIQQQIKTQEKDISRLQAKYSRLTPKSSYLVVNSYRNTFKLIKDGEVIREGICSTGSLTLLEGPEGKQWLFHTPKGVFSILGKIKYPVWRKPDWAFIEEGEPVPAANAPERYEAGVLGDYALSIGDGYLIHGTLYKRQLGMAVTHGCVRLGDDDLKVIYHTLAVGSKVMLY